MILWKKGNLKEKESFNNRESDPREKEQWLESEWKGKK
jgi:hypothetical protein